MGALGKCEDARLLVKVIDKAKEDGKLPKKIKASIKEITGRDVFVLRKEGKISEVFFDSNKNGELDIDTDLKCSDLKKAVDSFDKALEGGVPKSFEANKLREKYDFAIYKYAGKASGDKVLGVMFDLKADGAIDSFNSISLRRDDSWGSVANFTDLPFKLKEAKISSHVKTLIVEWCSLKSLKELPEASGLETLNARHNKISDTNLVFPKGIKTVDLRNSKITGAIALNIPEGAELIDLRGNKITDIDLKKSELPKIDTKSDPVMIVVDYKNLKYVETLKSNMTEFNVQFVAYNESAVSDARIKWAANGKKGRLVMPENDDGPLPARIKKK